LLTYASQFSQGYFNFYIKGYNKNVNTSGFGNPTIASP